MSCSNCVSMMITRRCSFALLCVFSVFFVLYILYNSSNIELFTLYSSTPILSSLILDASKQTGDRIFCMILTKPDNFDSKARTTYQTWAHKCDLHRYITVIPEKYRGQSSTFKPNSSLELSQNLNFLQPEGLIAENYSKLTTKVLLAMKDIYDRYRDKFDWFLKADDDTFVFMDNLHDFVRIRNTSASVTYGYNFKVIVEKGYHSGGGGYLLTKEAFTRLGKKLSEDMSFCPNSGIEDVDIARCLRKLKVVPEKSIDECGRERFHPLDIDIHLKGAIPAWLNTYAENPPKTVSSPLQSP